MTIERFALIALAFLMLAAAVWLVADARLTWVQAETFVELRTANADQK